MKMIAHMMVIIISNLSCILYRDFHTDHIFLHFLKPQYKLMIVSYNSELKINHLEIMSLDWLSFLVCITKSKWKSILLMRLVSENWTLYQRVHKNTTKKVPCLLSSSCTVQTSHELSFRAFTCRVWAISNVQHLNNTLSPFIKMLAQLKNTSSKTPKATVWNIVS